MLFPLKVMCSRTKKVFPAKVVNFIPFMTNFIWIVYDYLPKITIFMINNGLDTIFFLWTKFFREALELEEARKHQFHAKGVGETVPKFKHPGTLLISFFKRGDIFCTRCIFLPCLKMISFPQGEGKNEKIKDVSLSSPKYFQLIKVFFTLPLPPSI